MLSSMLIRNLQFEKKMMSRKISFVKKPGNQVALLDLLIASSECCIFSSDFNRQEGFSP